MKKQELFFRLVGFDEIWALLDLDRFDEILLEKMHMSGELNEKELGAMQRDTDKENSWPVEIYEKPSHKCEQMTSDVHADDYTVVPATANRKDVGKSLGKMPVEDARLKLM